jgi:hypothetical protein
MDRAERFQSWSRWLSPVFGEDFLIRDQVLADFLRRVVIELPILTAEKFLPGILEGLFKHGGKRAVLALMPLVTDSAVIVSKIAGV